MIRIEPFLKEDFEKLISWIDNEESLVQFAGPIFEYPLTKEQLAIYISDDKRFAFNGEIWTAINMCYSNMKEIQYKTTKEFSEQELKDLFLSVNWSSGNYPDKLVIAMKNSSSVFTAWDGDKLIGLINVLGDGIMTAYVHYLLIMPDYQHAGVGKKLVNMVSDNYKDYLRIVLIAYDKEIDFYKHCGFEVGEEKTPMFITTLWT